MSIRLPLDLKATVRDAIIEMSEGNPGALNALMAMAGDHRFAQLLTVFDLCNIRGSQIWIVYNDWARCDPSRLFALMESDPCLASLQEIIAVVNGATGFPDQYEHEARLPEPESILNLIRAVQWK